MLTLCKSTNRNPASNELHVEMLHRRIVYGRGGKLCKITATHTHDTNHSSTHSSNVQSNSNAYEMYPIFSSCQITSTLNVPLQRMRFQSFYSIQRTNFFGRFDYFSRFFLITIIGGSRPFNVYFFLYTQF